MNERLDRLAESHGIQLAYISELGERHMISDEAKERLLRVLGIDPEHGPFGSFDEANDQALRRCHHPSLGPKGVWGVACQLYSLRSRRGLGLGDFEDLATLATIAGAAGAAFVGVNPLHALFSADPGRFSPYSPSSRRFLNPLYIAIDRVEGGATAIAALKAEAPEAFDGLDGDLIDYPKVGGLKIRLLRAIFEDRKERILGDDEFQQFCAGGGEALRDFALFEAISTHVVADGGHAGWHNWPDELRMRRNPAVHDFAEANEEELLFHLWLQYQAEEQLGEAQSRAKAAGMRLGLYLDLAVGVAPDGAETWADPSLTVGAARIGSPPDMFNSQGQDWGLAPLSPTALAARGFAPLRDSFEALMRNAGAIRIDHAMGLARLWWIPEGVGSKDGGYVRYPLGRMIDIVAEASERNRCIVIGEDLGTVPPGFRHAMHEAAILSYRLLYFERHGEAGFLHPWAYPDLALACVSTHDLPTLAGWWTGEDVRLRQEVGTQDQTATDRTWEERRRDRRALVMTLKDCELLPAELDRAASGEEAMPPELPFDLVLAVHRFVARTRSVMVAVQLDDMVGSTRQPNMPGTTDQYPNWRIRSLVLLDDLEAHDGFQALAQAMREERPA
ncbi:4-alpha-glucanotransferase [Consotaella aegiceratis]|uniref:4-alpha-glucanotransferase n=1 Tax=Consotaella aegiceratis TaxID=3097961 RepID=UPI002F3E425F